MYKKMLDFSGKTAIVTGACGLLGKEFSRAFLECDANVILCDINEEQGIILQNKFNLEYDNRSLFFPMNITSEIDLQSFIQYCKKQSFSIDILVNNAYPRNNNYGNDFKLISFKDWRENIDMHLNGYFNVIQKISMVMMKQNKGNIINIASIYGFLGPNFSLYEGTSMTNPAEYSAIKGAIINFTRYLSTYLAPNIRANCISPGGVFDKQNQMFVDRYNKLTPMSRMANPDDIATVVLFLASDLSKYITGQNIVVDGGWSVW